ncbi:MAG: hypothetical protein K2X42_05450, partial [Burkholderiaceae bacterium]|nr:hypothetical protein [Burkholderiaceae bacterium]
EERLGVRLMNRTTRSVGLTEAGELLPRVATEPSFYECKYCAWARRCWSEQAENALGVQS